MRRQDLHLNSHGNISKTLLTLIFFFLLATGGGLLFLNHGQRDGEMKAILVPRKSSIASVVALLESQGIVKHPTLFKNLLRVTGGSSKVRAGEFRFRMGMSLMGALNVLYHDEPIIHSVTIPEGWTVRQIADILAKEQLVDSQKFVALAFNPSAPARFQLNSPSLEGFLYPDTYVFSRVDGEERIIEKMVQQFMLKFDDKIRLQAKAMGWSMEQVATLASIIEKETGVGTERALISSVFHNRLKKRMRLQSDPTTIYGIENFNGNLTKKHLQTKTPYNTYTIYGLPPGPIANAGQASLMAAVFPATSDYLFFVANNRGAHIFSKTYAEHSRQVRTFQSLNEPIYSSEAPLKRKPTSQERQHGKNRR